MGKGKAIDGYYFNKLTEADALSALEQSWPLLVRDGSKPIMRDAPKSSNEKLWRHQGGIGYLGIRPKLMAVALLSRFNNEQVVTQESLRLKIEQVKLGRYPDQVQGAALPSPGEVSSAVSDLLKKSSRTFKTYKPDLEPIYFTEYLIEQVNACFLRMKNPKPDPMKLRKDVADVWKTLEEQKPTRVSDVLALLKPLLPAGAKYMAPAPEDEPDQDFSQGKHVIAPAWMRYLPDHGDLADAENPDAPRDKAAKVLKELATQPGVMLHGNAIAGKSSVVVEVLRTLAHDAAGNTIALKTSDGELPVCLINVRENSGMETSFRILAFLKTLGPKGHVYSFDTELAKLRAAYEDDDKIFELDAMLGKIEELCRERPAFYIFTNWDEQGETSPRSMMRDQSKAALARALQSNSKGGRLLITTLGSEVPKPEKRFLSTLPPMSQIPLSDPVFSQINRYWKGLTIDNTEHEALIEELSHKIGGRKVPGAHLMLIAVLLQLVGRKPENPTYQDAFARVRTELDVYAEAVTSTVGRKATRYDAAVRPLIRMLMDELHRQDLMRIVLAVASSDDGLRPTSVMPMLNGWAEQSGIPLLRSDPLDALERILEPLAASFFLRKVPSAARNPHQLAADEEAAENDPQYEVNQTVRQLIFSEIYHPDSTQWKLAEGGPTCVEWAHGAMRHVGILARRRARNWRLGASMTNLTRNWRDLLPDIQAYESMLASLDPDSFPKVGAREVTLLDSALHLQETTVFREAKVYDPVLAFRFAVKCMLRKEVDLDGRLSMVFDQDHLRTKLCVLPFMTLGKKHFLRAMELSQVHHLPCEMPSHIRCSFSSAEIIDMLSSAALSAYHSQCVETLDWTNKMLNQELQYVKTTKPDVLPSMIHRGVRIMCSVIDMSVLKGRPIWVSRKTKAGHTETHGNLRETIKRHYGDIDAAFGDAMSKGFGPDQIEQGIAGLKNRLIEDRSENPPADPLSEKKIVAWMRLKVREATLLDLIGFNDAAIAVFDGLHLVEGLIEEYFDGVGPFVMSGRPARAELAVRFRSSAFRSHGRGNSADAYAVTDRQITSLIQGSTARLVRFGGGEQAATLISLALYAALRRGSDRHEAMTLARRARNAVERDQASLSMHVYILSAQLYIATLPISAARAKATHGINVKQLLEDAELLLGLGKSLKLNPTLVEAFYYRAIIRQELNKSGAGQFTKLQIHADLKEAQGYLDAAAPFPMNEAISNALAGL